MNNRSGLNEPFLPSGLGVTNPQIPFFIFGGSALVGGLAAALLPETRGERLPETVQDVEEIVLKRTKICWRRPETTDL